jgi:hypothetical protein
MSAGESLIQFCGSGQAVHDVVGEPRQPQQQFLQVKGLVHHRTTAVIDFFNGSTVISRVEHERGD